MPYSIKEKIILGTVQLGLPYGINNSVGRPTVDQAFQILDFAFENGINTLDSADGYGEALQVIGRHKATTGKSFKIINKFKLDKTRLDTKVITCLELLQCPSLSCYMYHEFSDYKSKKVSADLMKLKNRGLIEKIGVSLYQTDQLREVISDSEIDIIQLPVNILDLSLEKKDLLQQAIEGGKQIHARSVFLQGLFLKDPLTITGNLVPMRPYLERLAALATLHQSDIKRVALNFVLHQDCIDNVVLGVDRIDQLKENLDLVEEFFDSSVFGSIEINGDDAHLLNPVSWKV